MFLNKTNVFTSMDNLGEDFRSKLLELDHATTLKNASIWRRAVALFIDLFAMNFIVFNPFQSVLATYFETASLALESSIPGYVYASVILMSFVVLIYFALFQHYFQQTLGMMVMKLYVMPQTGFWKSIARNLFILPFFPFNLLWIIEPAYLLFKGRRILEKITKTNTVVENG